jgi:hypothetical protein
MWRCGEGERFDGWGGLGCYWFDAVVVDGMFIESILWDLGPLEREEGVVVGLEV